MSGHSLLLNLLFLDEHEVLKVAFRKHRLFEREFHVVQLLNLPSHINILLNVIAIVQFCAFHLNLISLVEIKFSDCILWHLLALVFDWLHDRLE